VVRGLRLWAHVGVLEHEREHGQWFELDLEVALDLAAAASSDALSHTLDYSQLIAALQQQARVIRCHTLEHYAACILDCLIGASAVQRGNGSALPMLVELRKCGAPVPGFNGSVGVRCSRHWPPL
jgi:dihydroneopterin aldolase